jgi:hypothetical protein
MNKDKIIVYVTASFAGREPLFKWLRRFAHHSNDQFAYWDEFAFTTREQNEYDAILVLNTPSEKLTLSCDPGKVIAIMMEPGIPHMHPWMFNRTEQYAAIFSPAGNKENIVPSHGYMGWYFDQDFSALKDLPFPEKNRPLSCIVSSLKQLEGHRLRLNFINKLRKEIPDLDMFGKGTNYITDKMQGLLPYRYSLAIENASIPYYFTEKINDCFLAYTVPFYYGCRNISKFFPSKSYIPIDINDTAIAIKKVRDTIANDDWNARMEAVREARELVLHRYQPLAGCAAALRSMPTSQKQKIELKPVNATILQRLAAFRQYIFNRH